MIQNLTGWHALILLAVVLLIFGAAKLPALARGIGQSLRILKDESRSDADQARNAEGPDRAAAAAPPTTAVTVDAARMTPVDTLAGRAAS